MIGARRKLKFDAENYGRFTHVADEDVMSIAANHADGVGIKVEARTIVRLGHRFIIGDVHGFVIDDGALQAIAAH